jgi:nucleotide-binding universal stress UspA family protein
VAQTLRDAATLFGADMLVMGGYVHSRLRELIFGGVTQSLLKTSPSRSSCRTESAASGGRTR